MGRLDVQTLGLNYLLVPGEIFHVFLSSADFFQNQLFQEYHLIVKRIESRSGPTFKSSL